MNINNTLIRESERSHYIMQLSSYFSELTDLPGVRFSYTHLFTDIWYNQAYDINWNSEDFDQLIRTIEGYCKNRDRLPCIYLTPASKPDKIQEFLKERDYDKFENEAWMFYDFAENKKPYAMPKEITINEVQSDKDLEVFSEVYRQGLPGPEVEKYIQATIDGLRNKPPLVDIRYFVASYEGEPASMLSLLKIGHYAGIYAVATVEKFQQKGMARALNRHAATLAKDMGAKYMFLQTVVGEDSETVFKKLGYQTWYEREGFTTKEVISSLEHG
jgi:GNAT superfamily N-acetyltransferase